VDSKDSAPIKMLLSMWWFSDKKQWLVVVMDGGEKGVRVWVGIVVNALLALSKRSEVVSLQIPLLKLWGYVVGMYSQNLKMIQQLTNPESRFSRIGLGNI